jgi:hypothetical protein
MKVVTRTWAFQSEKQYGPLPEGYKYRSLCPAVGEVVGHRLMRTLGIGTAPSVEILETKEALHRDPRRWIFKPVKHDRLKASSPAEAEGRWVLLVEKIPRAITLSFLRKKYGIDAGKVEITTATADVKTSQSAVRTAAMLNDRSSGNDVVWVPTADALALNLAGLKRIIWEGKPELPTAEEFYSDFVPPEDWSAIKRAIAWDSAEMLAVHAARLFLGISIAHTSNVLVDRDGRLYSIDHEFCTATGGEDLVTLFEDIKSGTRAFEALRGVAQLSEEKLRELFEGLPGCPGRPAWFRWPLGSKEKTVAHYLKRLRLWKFGFEKLSRAQALSAPNQPPRHFRLSSRWARVSVKYLNLVKVEAEMLFGRIGG